MEKKPLFFLLASQAGLLAFPFHPKWPKIQLGLQATEGQPSLSPSLTLAPGESLLLDPHLPPERRHAERGQRQPSRRASTSPPCALRQGRPSMADAQPRPSSPPAGVGQCLRRRHRRPRHPDPRDLKFLAVQAAPLCRSWTSPASSRRRAESLPPPLLCFCTRTSLCLCLPPSSGGPCSSRL